jgi:aminoglycoside N3'-acetyltransferase
MLARDGAYRSQHPTNSFVALGRGASAFLASHDQTAACFSPVAPLMDRGGKMLLLGCEVSSPGFSTVHLAQHRLGLDTRTWMSLVFGRRYYKPDGGIAWYRKRDVPGCSMGFSRFYPVYRDRGLLREGRIGAANGMLIEARAAFEVELAQLQNDPTAALCDNDACLICRLGWFYKPIELGRYLKARRRRLPHAAGPRRHTRHHVGGPGSAGAGR